MVIGQHKAIFLHDNAGAEGGLNTLLLIVKETSKIGIVEQGMIRGSGYGARIYIYHRGGGAFYRMGVGDRSCPFIALAAPVEVHRGLFNAITLLANFWEHRQY